MTLLRPTERHGGVARLDRRASREGVLGPGEQVRVDRQRHPRIGMPELARHEHHVEPFRDEERGVPVTEAVEREPTVSADPRPAHGLAVTE